MLIQRFALTAMAVLVCHAVYADTAPPLLPLATTTAAQDTLAPILQNAPAAAVAPKMSANTPAPIPAAAAAKAVQVVGAVEPAVAAEETDADGGARIMRGNDRVIAPPRTPFKVEGPPNTFKFEDAPITEVVHVMLGEILKVDYVLHQPVSGSVTLATRGPVPPDQAIFLLESALQANGVVMARDARGVYHVGRAEALKGIVAAPRLVGNNSVLPPGSGAIIVPLQYIGATEMATILRPMLPPDALLRVDNLRNLLVLGGTRTQAEGWLELINTFDVDMLKGMSVGIFPLKYATVGEVDAALRLMTSGGGGGGAAAGASRPAATGAGAAGSGAAAASAGAQGDSNPFFGAVRIMPIERISSILVVAPRASSLDEARRWIERFDKPSDSSTEAQLFVYPVQNGSAKHLAAVISGVFGGGSAGGAQSGTGGTGVAPGLGSSSASTQGFGGQLGSSNLTSSASSAANRSGTSGQAGAAPGVTSSTLGQGGVRIIADEVNNALLIYGPRSEYTKIESTLRRLDIRSAQVLIEATLIEVTLKDELAYGLQWAFNDSRRNTGYTGTGVLSTLGGGVLGPALKGFSYTLSNAAGDVRAVLNALADKSLVKMLSSPTLMVLDNQTASIVVGNQQPIRSGETVSTTGAAISTSIQYKDTGVSLAFTPSVNAGNFVTMMIKQSVTDVGEKDDATGQRAFLQRQLESKVAIRSGETLVLGGLIRDNTTTTKSGIPLLQDIPVLGAAFRNSGSLTNRTELLVILTPRVVRSDEDARELTDEVRTRMKTFSTIPNLDPRYSGTTPRIESSSIYAPPFNKGVVTP